MQIKQLVAVAALGAGALASAQAGDRAIVSGPQRIVPGQLVEPLETTLVSLD